MSKFQAFAAFVCLIVLSGCASSSGRSASGTAPSKTSGFRSPSTLNQAAFLNGVKSQTALSAPDSGLSALGLLTCSWLDGGADLTYVERISRRM